MRNHDEADRLVKHWLEQMKRRVSGEGSVYLTTDSNGRPRWVAAAPGGRPVFTSRVQSEAIEKRAAWLRQNPDHRYHKGSFAEWLRTWLQTTINRAKPVRPNTYAAYSLTVTAHIIPSIGHVTLSRLTPADIEHAMSVAQRAGKHRTAAMVRDVCRMALGKAMKRGMVTRNVALLVDPPRVDKRASRPIHGNELSTLLAFLVTHDAYAALILLDLFVGLRRGELLGLMWRDLDGSLLRVERQLVRSPHGGLVLTVPKSSKGVRTIKLPAVVIDALKRHRVRQKKQRMRCGAHWVDSGHIFTSRIGTPIDPRNLKRIFDSIWGKVGIAHRTIHDLRHTAATLLLAGGATLSQVQDLLGHAKSAFTKDTYGHVIPEVFDGLAAKMDEIADKHKP